MKYVIPVLLLALPVQSFGKELSQASIDRLDAHLDASAVQLAIPSTCNNLQKDKEFATQVMERAGATYGPIARLRDPSLTLAAVGGGGVLVGSLTAMSGEDNKNMKTYVLGKNLMKVGAGIGAGALVVASYAQSAGEKDQQNAPLILNTTAVDNYAKRVAKDTAEIFSLNLDEEVTIRGAIKSEIQRKAKANDLSPMNYYDVLKNASFRKKPVLSSEQQVVLEKMRTAASDVANEKEFSPEEKLAALVVATSALDICAKQKEPKSGDGKNIRKRISKNVQLMRELGEDLKLKIKPVESDEPADKSSLD